MKKNLIIALLAITTVLSMAFAIYQRGETERYRGEAIQHLEKALAMQDMAEKATMLAREQQVLAEAHAKEAQRQLELANEALAKAK